MAIGGLTLTLGMGCGRRAINFQKKSIWDGSIASSFGGGTGTITNPYLITNAAELAYFAKTVNDGDKLLGKYIEQTINIDINNIAWAPIGTVTNYFNGSFNGAGYTIANIYIYTSSNYQGLFGEIYGNGVISNVGIISGSITGGNYIGGITGGLYAGKILGCFNKASINAYSVSSQFIGGIAGKCDSTNVVSRCFNTGNIISTGNYVGGVGGYFSNGEASYNYSAASVSTTAAKLHGALFGNKIAGTTNYNYYDNTLCIIGGINYADVSNQAEGRSTAQMKTQSTFVGWDFANDWYILTSYPQLISFYKSSYFYKALGNYIQDGDVAINTFEGANIAAGNQYKVSQMGIKPKRILSGKKFFAIGKADHYVEDDMLDIPLLTKYGFSGTFYVQLPLAADNPLNTMSESATNYNKRSLKRIFSSGCYLGNHGIQHFAWLYIFPMFNGFDYPSNDDFRIERSDGTNAFGFDVDTTLNDAYTATITSSAYLNISFGATTFRDLTDSNCIELCTKVSFFTASDYRYSQDILKIYDYLSNRYCGTTGYSVLTGDYNTRTPNTLGGLYPTDDNKIRGGIFQGASTLCNHEVWERIELIYKAWTQEFIGRNHDMSYWAIPGGVTNGFYYVPVSAINMNTRYYDRECTKRASGFSKFYSSILGTHRGYMNVLEDNGYKSTMAPYIGFGWTNADGQARRESNWVYKLNSGLHRTNYIGDGYNRAIRPLDYELADDATEWANFLASTNLMLDKYNLTKADIDSTSLTSNNNFAQVIEDVCTRIAWGLIPESVEDNGVGTVNTTQKRACEAITYELIYQFCKQNGIEIISHEEASTISFQEIIKGENIFPNYDFNTTVKDYITSIGGSTLCDLFPDGWSAGEMVLEGSVRTFSTSVITWVRSYIIQIGSALLSLEGKGKGIINIYIIRNKHLIWVSNVFGACQYELIGSIVINSLDYTLLSLSFQVPLEPIKVYTSESEDYCNYMKGLDDRICGLHIEIIPDSGQSITIKSPSLIVN